MQLLPLLVPGVFMGGGGDGRYLRLILQPLNGDIEGLITNIGPLDIAPDALQCDFEGTRANPQFTGSFDLTAEVCVCSFPGYASTLDASTDELQGSFSGDYIPLLFGPLGIFPDELQGAFAGVAFAPGEGYYEGPFIRATDILQGSFSGTVSPPLNITGTLVLTVDALTGEFVGTIKPVLSTELVFNPKTGKATVP